MTISAVVFSVVFAAAGVWLAVVKINQARYRRAFIRRLQEMQ